MSADPKASERRWHERSKKIRRIAQRQAIRRARRQGLVVFAIRESREHPCQHFAAETRDHAFALAFKCGDRRGYDDQGRRVGVWGRL